MPDTFVWSRDSARRQDHASLRGTPSIVATPADFAVGSKTAPLVGSLFYLGSIGLVAAGIAVMFFGAGFSLLAPPAGGWTSGSAKEAVSAVLLPPPFPANLDQAAFADGGDAPHNSGSLAAPAARPWPPHSNPSHEPAQAGDLVPPVLQNPSAAPTGVNPRPSEATAAQLPVQATARLSGAELGDLLEHGDALLRMGDVASARLFYERAADAGDGRAALRLGATFDPIFLARFGGNVHADEASARSWYSRALDLGALAAKGQLDRLETRPGN